MRHNATMQRYRAKKTDAYVRIQHETNAKYRATAHGQEVQNRVNLQCYHKRQNLTKWLRDFNI